MAHPNQLLTQEGIWFMHKYKWLFFLFVFLSLSRNDTTAVQPLAAQQQGVNRLFITGSDVGSPPAVELHVYGIDPAGNALDLSNQILEVQHNGTAVPNVNLAGHYESGTFTLFLIDVPTGVVDEITLIQNAILQFAAVPTMAEQVDALAIYKVGETAGIERLAPTSFYNSIRNFFTSPITPETGSTALIDSLVGLIDQINTLKPNPDMPTSIVVISDGTDAVSTRFKPEDVVTHAVQAGTAVHTIWLHNTDLSAGGQDNGRRYLAQVASDAWGVSADIEDAGQVAAIWNRIATFRSQTRVTYTVDGLSGGTFPVSIQLGSDTSTQATATITIPTNSPSIVLNIPAESRSLTLPALDQPITLHLAASLNWLDGTVRQAEAVQLQVNGTVVQDVSPDAIAGFTATISNFVYGANVVQLAMLDDQGMRVTSPAIVLTVSEGPESIPADLQGGGSSGSLGSIVLVLVVLVALGGGGFFLMRSGLLKNMPAFMPRGRSGRKQAASVVITDDTGGQVDDGRYESPADYADSAYLEVLETASSVPSLLALTPPETKIGRSPAQAQIVFANDATVSRLHATMRQEGRHWRIFDNGSSSGTWVNDAQVPEYGTPLVDGDEIFLGKVQLRFREN